MVDFEFIEHTADLGLRIYGKNIKSLFQNAAQSLFEIIIDSRSQAESLEEISLEAENLEELFVAWLNELISLFFAYKFLPSEYFIEIEERDNLKILKSRIKGANFNPSENKIKMEIKAATYHNLKVVKTDDGYMAEVIFDI
jgi:SHS2 domain-containing protein